MRSPRLLAVALAAAALSACSTARDVDPAAARGDCAGCHGFPPATTASSAAHPNSTSCYLCHSSTVNASGALVAGGTHTNGQVDRSTHAIPFAGHTAAALADIAACTFCHGSDYAGGESGRSCNGCHDTEIGAGYAGWRTNCTFCHGTRQLTWALTDAAPPAGVDGETATTDRAVGAHDRHLGVTNTISAAVECSDCHDVPTVENPLAHLDAEAVVSFGALARTGNLAPSYASLTCSSTYCHGATLQGGTDTSPTWTSTVACGSCHGSPPVTGRHVVTPHNGILCVNCHLDVADALSVDIRDEPAARALHVNGEKDVRFPTGTWNATEGTCSNVECHQGAPIRAWRP